jgi:hypothetical protein
LEAAVAGGGAGTFAFGEDFAGHVDQLGPVDTCGDFEALGDTVAIGVGAGAGKIEVAKNRVVFTAENEGQSFFGGGRAIDLHGVGGEPFHEEHADAFLVIDNKDGAFFEQVEGGSHHFAGAGGIEFAADGSGKFVGRSDGKINGKSRATPGEGLDFNIATVLADDGHADAEAEAGAAAGALGGEKRIENSGKHILGDTGAVIPNGGKDAGGQLAEANVDVAGGMGFADGLLGVADEIQENLNELVGVANGGRQARGGVKLDLNLVTAERMFVELESAIDDGVEIEGFFLRRGRARKFKQVLHDAGGATGLAMGHLELAARVVVDAGAIAEKFAGAKNGGERIVQFVSDTGEHLAHGGEFFGLDELLFEAFDFGDVAAGDDDTFNVAGNVKERTKIAAEAAPLADFVADAEFDGSEFAFAQEQIFEDGEDGGAIFEVGAVAEDGADGFVGVIAEDFFDLGADEGVAPVGVDHEDQVGEAVDETASKFLLLIEALFHSAALSDVGEGALIADDFAGGIADGGGSVEASDGLAVFATEGDFAALGRRLALYFAGKRVAQLGIDENVADFFVEELFLGVVAQHLNEGGIDLDDLVVGSDDVDAFLESFEKFSETSFVAALGGNVASENGEAMNLIVANHGVSDAIKEEGGSGLFEADMDDPVPDAALKETVHHRAHFLFGGGAFVGEEVADRKADDFLKGKADEIGKAAVGGANFAFEAEGEKDIVKGIDEIAEALLGLGDHLEELVEGLIGRQCGIAVFPAAEDTFQFGNLLGLFPDVDTEKNDEEDQAKRNSFEAELGGADGIPRKPSQDRGDQEENEEGEAPEFLLAAFVFVETSFDGITGRGSRGRKRLVGGMGFQIHGTLPKMRQMGPKGLLHDGIEVAERQEDGEAGDTRSLPVRRDGV